MAREPAAGAGDEGAAGPALQRMVEAFEELDRMVNIGQNLDEVLGAVVSVAAQRIPAADAVSVSTFARDRFTTVAASSDLAREADAIQREVGEGPCRDTLFHDAVYNPQELAHDRRWPEFGRRVTSELSVHSMLSYRLLTGPDSAETQARAAAPAGPGTAAGLLLASLNIYSRTPHGFDEPSVMTGLLLATHARSAVEANIAHREAEHLDQALRNSREIGTAIGILMANHVRTRDQAFHLLRITSQQLNRKLRDVAGYVADTGELPSVPPGRGTPG
jgi:hypothetical protein